MLVEKLKKVLPFLISENQTAYVKGRFIREGGRLISDILEISDNLKIKGFLWTLDFEKNVRFSTRKVIIWIQILIQNQDLCVINGGTITNYFKLERGTMQGDPISVYTFFYKKNFYKKLSLKNPKTLRKY